MEQAEYVTEVNKFCNPFWTLTGAATVFPQRNFRSSLYCSKSLEIHYVHVPVPYSKYSYYVLKHILMKTKKFLLVSALLLEGHLSSVYKTCVLYLLTWTSVNRYKLRACSLMWLILITSCKTKLRWHFSACQHFSMDVCRPPFRSNLFDLSSEIRKLSSHDSCSASFYTNTKWFIPIQNSIFLICNQRLE